METDTIIFMHNFMHTMHSHGVFFYAVNSYLKKFMSKTLTPLVIICLLSYNDTIKQ